MRGLHSCRLRFVKLALDRITALDLASFVTPKILIAIPVRVFINDMIARRTADDLADV